MGERFGFTGVVLLGFFMSAGAPRKGVSVRLPKMLSARCNAGHVLSTISMTRPDDMRGLLLFGG